MEGLMLKLQYFGHLMQRTDSLEKTLMLGKIEEKGAAEDEMVGWHHQLSKLAQTHVVRVDDAIQPSYRLFSPSLLSVNISQHPGLFK